MSYLPNPDVPPGPLRELLGDLHDLHHRAGWPSLRVLARRAGCSHTTVAKVFSSGRPPSWGLLEVLVDAMDGDVEAFRVLWLKATALPGPASSGAIAGRREELALVRRHLEEAPGRLLLLAGEAGIGKTRLAAQAATLVARDPVVAVGQCLPFSTAVPLLPVTDLLRSVHALGGGEWIREALGACPSYVAGSLRRLLPELDVPSIPPEDPDDQWARQRLFGAVSTLLTALPARRRLALLIEDLHWADADTLDLLEYLLAQGVGTPIVGTWRLDDPATPAATVDWSVRVRRLPSVQVLTLAELSLDETAEQLALLGYHDDDLTDRIHRRSRGQPLFTEQLVSHGEGDGSLPGLLSDLLDRHVSGLSEPAWAMCRALGVADRPLRDGLLREATGLAEPDLSSGLHELDARHLLTGCWSEDVRLRHPLFGEAVRRRLTAQERRAVHRRLAATLGGSPDASPAEVAAHWQRAEDEGQEIRWRIRAALAAHERFALRQEAEQWRRVLALWPPGTTEVEGGAGLRKCDVYLSAMTAIKFIDFAAAWALAQDAMRDLADTTGEAAARTYALAGELRGYVGHQDEALQLVQKALRIYEQAPPSSGYVDALSNQEYLLSAVGRDEEGAASASRAAAISAALGLSGRRRVTLSVVALYEALSGHVDRAIETMGAATQIASSACSPSDDVYVAINHTVVLLTAAAEPDDVAEAARPGIESAAAWDLDTWPLSVLRANVARAMRLAGRIDDAAELLDPRTKGPPNALHAPEHTERANLDVVRGRLEAAAQRHDALESIATDTLADRMEAVADVAMGDLWRGDPRRALERVLPLLRESLATDASGHAGELLVIAARAAADLAALEEPAGHAFEGRQRMFDVLTGLRAGARHDPFGDRCGSAAPPAVAASWHAETARLAGDPVLARWSVAAREWQRVGRRHDEAYALWRASQVCLATGERTTAGRLLQRAAHRARGHVPLSELVTASSKVPAFLSR